MRTVNSVYVRAHPDRVFDLAAEIERWPEILPHYRWVDVIYKDGEVLLAEMAARRGRLPVKWISVQYQSRAERRIHYRHIGGLTTGMLVEWRLIPTDEGVHISIIHDLELSHPIVGNPVGRWIVGKLFVGHIAGKTLRCIKTLAEVQDG